MAEVQEAFLFKNTLCVRLAAAGYTAVISPLTGASVLRLRNEEKNCEIFRYQEAVSMEEIDCAREIWGLPTLYLPNRYDGGVLKTADAVYKLPINEAPLGNFIHGFVHKRPHTVESVFADADTASVTTRFYYGADDVLFAAFPLAFEITYTFTLSARGLAQNITLISHADKALPVSICTHTCLNAPLVDSGDERAMTLRVPVTEKCGLDARCLPDEMLSPLDDWDMEYKTGTKRPTKQNISNDMYTADFTELDSAPFYGVVVTDAQSGLRLCNEVSPEFKFWNMWNDGGEKGYFCPEPMTAMINAPNLSLPREVTGYRELSNGERFDCWQRFFVI
ncbi:MAG: aldose 1-epimerase [Oscillospiraceae bacterium]